MSGLPDPGQHALLQGVDVLAQAGRGEASTHCLDCGERLHGRYCSRCGQEARSLEVSVRDVAGEALEDLFSLDSRAWITLRRLITRPGFLTLEHWHGRRARYVPPMRLYLLLSFLCFLILIPIDRVEMLRMDGRGDGIIKLGIEGGGEAEMAEIVAAVEQQAEESGGLGGWLLSRVAVPVLRDVPAAESAFARRLPAIAFVLVPVLALELMILFRRRVRYFVQHLIVALHLQSFFFVILTLTTLLGLLIGETASELLLMSTTLVYAYLALRTVYWEQSRLVLAVKIPILVFAHLFAVGLGMLVTFVVVGLSL